MKSKDERTHPEVYQNKRIGVVLLVVICVVTVFITGCKGNTGMTDGIVKGAEDAYSKESLSKLLKCIQQKNIDDFFDVFSVEALDKEFATEEVIQLFQLFPDGIAEIEYDGGHGSESNYYGKKIIEYKEFYIIESDTKYRLLIEGCARNDYNKSGVGIKRIILYPEAYGPYPDAPEYGVYVFE